MAAAQIVQCFGHVDILINNAGISYRGAIQDTAVDVDRKVMETNYFGPVALTKGDILAWGCLCFCWSFSGQPRLSCPPTPGQSWRGFTVARGRVLCLCDFQPPLEVLSSAMALLAQHHSFPRLTVCKVDCCQHWNREPWPPLAGWH